MRYAGERAVLQACGVSGCAAARRGQPMRVAGRAANDFEAG